MKTEPYLTLERRITTLEGMVERLARAITELEKAEAKLNRREHRKLRAAASSVAVRFDRRQTVRKRR
jgi:hypothetical protein